MFTWHGTIEEEYEEALERGVPDPILYIAEKFTRGSTCRLLSPHSYSGRYASATLWYTNILSRLLTPTAALTLKCPHRSAFCCWLLANVLFCMPVPLYGGYMTLATAGFLFSSVASFSTVMNAPTCVFHIGNDSFQTQYSHSFWLALATGNNPPHPKTRVINTLLSFYFFSGLLCAATGLLVVMLSCARPDTMREAFSVGGADDEDVSPGEGYLSSLLLDGVAISPLTSEARVVSWGQLTRPPCRAGSLMPLFFCF